MKESRLYTELARKTTSTGERIKELMAEKDIIIKELKDAVGVSRQTVYNWLNYGKTPYNENFESMAKLFDVDVAYLKCEQPERKKQTTETSDNSSFEDESVNEALTKAFIRLLNEKGYDIFPYSFDYTDVEYSYMVPHPENNNDEKLYDEVSAKTSMKAGISAYQLYYPDADPIIVSAERIDEYIKNIVDYIDFGFQRLRNYSIKPADNNSHHPKTDIIENQTKGGQGRQQMPKKRTNKNRSDKDHTMKGGQQNE